MFRLLAGEAIVLALLVTVAADLAAHKRVENLGGLNIRGYRGPVAHQRQPNELRIAFVGGTRAFGWGVPVSETTAAAVRFELSRVLDQPNKPLMPIVAINLGQLCAPPESYADTLAHFAYLAPDYVTIVDDLGATGPNRPFEPSGVYAMSGYMPMLPLVLRERGETARARLIGAPLEYTGEALSAMDGGLARLTTGQAASPPSASSSEAYVSAIMRALDAAASARGIVLVLAPVDTDAQRRNADALHARLAGRTNARLRVVDLSDQPALYDPALRLDGFNFGAGASSIAAQAIAPALLQLIPAR